MRACCGEGTFARGGGVEVDGTPEPDETTTGPCGFGVGTGDAAGALFLLKSTTSPSGFLMTIALLFLGSGRVKFDVVGPGLLELGAGVCGVCVDGAGDCPRVELGRSGPWEDCRDMP